MISWKGNRIKIDRQPIIRDISDTFVRITQVLCRAKNVSFVGRINNDPEKFKFALLCACIIFSIASRYIVINFIRSRVQPMAPQIRDGQSPLDSRRMQHAHAHAHGLELSRASMSSDWWKTTSGARGDGRNPLAPPEVVRRPASKGVRGGKGGTKSEQGRRPRGFPSFVLESTTCIGASLVACNSSPVVSRGEPTSGLQR